LLAFIKPGAALKFETVEHCVVGSPTELTLLFIKERMLSGYLLASGDVLVVLAGIFSVAYLSWRRKAK